MARALDRTTRAHCGINGMVMAMITFSVPGPSVETIASAMMISGKAMNTSMTRCNSKSKRPPKYALATPNTKPITEPKNAAVRPTNNAVREP